LLDSLSDVNADIHAREAYRRAMMKVFTRAGDRAGRGAVGRLLAAR
jgi:hypothetical protein